MYPLEAQPDSIHSLAIVQPTECKHSIHIKPSGLKHFKLMIKNKLTYRLIDIELTTVENNARTSFGITKSIGINLGLN